MGERARPRARLRRRGQPRRTHGKRVARGLAGSPPDPATARAGRGPPCDGRRGREVDPPPEEIYELSVDRNLIHIVLDMFPSNLFAAIRDTDHPGFDRAWPGFTFYREHLGAFTGTAPSMPAMLTGVAWRNEIPLDSFVRRHPTVFHALGQQGYRLRSLGRDHMGGYSPAAQSTLRYAIPSPYGSYRDYVDTASAQLLNLSLFRHAPHPAKAYIYREGRWFLQARAARGQEGTELRRRPLGDATFVQEFANRITAGGDDPVYTFLHVITPHPPIVTDEDCRYTGRRLRMSPANFRAQARCALRAVESLLARLRELDLYDRSAIVVTSDHGTTLYPRTRNPLARTATPGGISLPRRRALRHTASPGQAVRRARSHADLARPDRDYRPAGHPARPRRPAEHHANRNFGSGPRCACAPPTHLRVPLPGQDRARTGRGAAGWTCCTSSRWTARVTDPDAWRYRRAIFEPSDDRAAQRRRHRVGLWQDDSDAVSPAGRSTYWMGDYAAFFVPADSGRVTFDVRKVPNLAEQTVIVRVDGEVLGRHRLSNDAWHTLDYAIPRRDTDSSPFCVELLASSVWPDSDPNPRGVMVRGDL